MHPSDSEVSALPIELVDRVDQDVLDLLVSASEGWSAVNTDELPRARSVALKLLAWSGLIELRLPLLAWDGGSMQARADCIVQGVYEKVLAHAVGQVLPRFTGRLRVQIVPECHYRLTLDGIQARSDAVDPLGINRITVLIAAKRMLPGRANVRNVEFNVSGVASVAAAQAVANASIGDVNVVVNVPALSQTQTSITSSGDQAKAAKPADDTPVATDDAASRRCGNWDAARVGEEIDAHIKKHWDQYIVCGRHCLIGKRGAAKALSKLFGPNAIAKAINKAHNISDPKLTCGPTHVSGNEVYLDRIKPLRNGEIPEGWPEDEPAVPTLMDDIREAIEGSSP